MKNLLRRLRAAVGMGVTWAVAWLGLGVAAGLAAFDLGAIGLMVNALASGAAGFVGGVAFAAVLGLADSRRRFDELSLPRVACWGALGGALVGGLQLAVFAAIGSVPNPLMLVAVQGLIGAGSAAGTLALARGADDRELLRAGDEVADVGLTAEEARQLLG